MEEVHKGKKSRWLRPQIMAFLMPVVILMILYIIRGVFPFGDRIYTRMDFYHQYAPFMKEFCGRVLNGGSLLYAWELGLGTNYWAHYAYYLASPINWLFVLVPQAFIIEAMNISMILRAGLAGTMFTLLLKEKYHEHPAMAVFGVFYALSGYYLAYACNIIWLDGFALFPLIACGILRIVKGKSARMYLFGMLICIFSNFYLAVIIGMCCVLWLVILCMTEKWETFSAFLKAVGKFAVSTVMCVAISSVILLPVAYALMNTPAGESVFPKEIEWYYSFFELLERMCMNCAIVLKGSKLPNIYASVLVLFLTPLYMSHKKISIRKRIVYGVTLLLLLVSFSMNVTDYVWHGMHFPNSFPARQSFFYIFLLLTMGYEVFTKRRSIKRPALFLTTGLMLAALAAIWFFFGRNQIFGGTHIYLCTMTFLLLYGVLFCLEKYVPAKVFLLLFFACCYVEIGVHTVVTGMDSLVTRSAYMEDDQETEWLLSQIMPMEHSFYRIEEQDRKSSNDAAWDGYFGASYFSSTIPGGLKEWYDAFGLRNSSVSYSYDGATPLVSSLLGVRYVFACEDGVRPGNTFTEEKLFFNEDEISLYENQMVLPLGYIIDENLETEFEYHYENPFLTQNEYASAVLKRDVSLFKKVEQYKSSMIDAWFEGAGAQNDVSDSQEPKEYICIQVAANSNVFLYVTTYMEAIDVEIQNMETGEITTVRFDDLKFKKILSIGVEDVGRTITISSADADVTSVNLLSYEMDESVFMEVYETLNAQTLKLTDISDTKIVGSIDVTQAGRLLLSVPYDEGWTVYVDGIKTDALPWKDAFLSVPLESGEHDILLRYCPKGFLPGAIVSLSATIGLLVLWGVAFWKNHFLNVRNNP